MWVWPRVLTVLRVDRLAARVKARAAFVAPEITRFDKSFQVVSSASKSCRFWSERCAQVMCLFSLRTQVDKQAANPATKDCTRVSARNWPACLALQEHSQTVSLLSSMLAIFDNSCNRFLLFRLMCCVFLVVTGTSQCALCDSGRFSVAGALAGATACTACTKGSFVSSSGQEACQACPVGYYSQVNGATNCLPCAAGSVSELY